MRLAELEACFGRYESRGPETWDTTTGPQTGMREYFVRVASLDEAQGVQFLCPKCFARNGGSVGTHWCEVSFEGRGVAELQGSHGAGGEPTRWCVSGTGLADLSTQPSIQIVGGCGWHGFITSGDAS